MKSTSSTRARHNRSVRPPEPLPGTRREYRVTVFDEPRAPWRPTRDKAMLDAIRLQLASWDDEQREHYLAVPVGMERRVVKV